MTVNLVDLQVVIFSRNRNKQLIESLRYWDECGIRTLVLHNTQDPICSIDLPSTTEYIVHTGSYAERCEIASRNLKFNFFIIASDDERYLPNALSKMVEQLQESHELTSVGGQAIGVMTHGLRYRTTIAYKSQIGYQNSASDFQGRFEYHYERGKNHSGAMYRVFRRNHFRKFLLLISKFSDLSTPYVYEVTAELFWTLIGPAKYINEVFWIRNWVVPPIQSGDWDRKQYFYEWCQDLERIKEFESWKKMVTKEFETLESNDDIIEKVLFHRMKIEQHEQGRNQKFEKKNQEIIKKLARAISSIFRQKYQTNELYSELTRLGVVARNDDVMVALTSMTR
jgi:hypothetical protein